MEIGITTNKIYFYYHSIISQCNCIKSETGCLSSGLNKQSSPEWILLVNSYNLKVKFIPNTQKNCFYVPHFSYNPLIKSNKAIFTWMVPDSSNRTLSVPVGRIILIIPG